MDVEAPKAAAAASAEAKAEPTDDDDADGGGAVEDDEESALAAADVKLGLGAYLDDALSGGAAFGAAEFGGGRGVPELLELLFGGLRSDAPAVRDLLPTSTAPLAPRRPRR